MPRPTHPQIPAQPPLPSLLDATSSTLVTGLDLGRFSSVDLVKAYRARIDEVNPALRCVMEGNLDAVRIAAERDREREEGKLRGSLHGLPVLIKGNIGTRDRMQTNAGSLALQNALLPSDSTIVSKLREHGLVILGKASLTEWSMFRSDNSSHSWNAVFGQTYGAYCEKQCPGGSSGGCAVAVDLGLAWGAVGTETCGSIIIPSSRNNIVGIKPSVGLTSRHLIVPVSEHQDTVGPLARTVEDAARLLQVIVGVDPHDSYTSASPFKHHFPNYPAACKASGLEGKRIGIARNVINSSLNEVKCVKDAFEHAISIIASAGATIVEDTEFTAFPHWKKREYNPVTRADFVTNLAQYLSKLEKNPQDIHSIQDLRTFTRTCPEEEYPARNTRNWDTAIEQNMNNTCAEFEPLYRENLNLGGEGGILGALERHGLDAVVLPTAVAADSPAMVGTPVITVPLGAASEDTKVEKEKGWDVVESAPGIPFGIAFLGRKWSEEVLIGMAYAFEQRTLVRENIRRWVAPNLDLADVVNSWK